MSDSIQNKIDDNEIKKIFERRKSKAPKSKEQSR
jgi:hypothetical protein